MPPDGPSEIVAVVVDAVGNVSAPAMQAVTVDTIKPTEPTLDPVAGDNRIIAAEMAAGVTLGGSAEPGSLVYLAFVGSVLHWKSVTADASGKWVATLASGEFLDGTFTVVPQVFDQAGNSS